MSLITFADNTVKFYDWIIFIADIVVALVAVSGIYFSIKSNKAVKVSNEITLAAIETDNLQYKIDHMPIISLKLNSDYIAYEEEFFRGEILIDPFLNATLINAGAGAATNIEVRVRTVHETKEIWEYILDNEEAGIQFTVPIYDNKKNKGSEKGFQTRFFSTLDNNHKEDLLRADSSVQIPENFLENSLKYSAYRFFFPGEAKLRNFTGLIYYVEISYASIFGEKISTKQIIRLELIPESTVSLLKLDDMTIENSILYFNFNNIRFEIESDSIEKMKNY